MGPFHGAALYRLQQLAVGRIGEKRRAFVAHIIRPEDAVHPVARIPHHIHQRNAAVEIGVEHVDHPFRFFQHGDQQGFGPHHPGVGDIKAEPHVAFDPAAFGHPAGIFGFEALPVDAVAVKGHARFGFSHSSGVITLKSRNSGVESSSLNSFMVTPHGEVTMR